MPTTASTRTTTTRKDSKRNKLWTRRIVFAFFIFIGLVVLMESPLTRIRHIVVQGHSVVDSLVVHDSGLRQGMSLWQVNAGAVAHRIMSGEPLVERVDVHTDYFSGTVTLGLTAKKQVAVYEQGGNLYSLLSDGTVYQSIKRGAVLTLPLVESASSQVRIQTGTVATVPGIVQLCKELGQAKQSELGQISQIVLNQYGDVTMYLDNGFAVQTGAGQVASTLSTVGGVITYFTGQGYGPGLIDMTGQPPYRYTPFQPRANSASASANTAASTKGK